MFYRIYRMHKILKDFYFNSIFAIIVIKNLNSHKILQFNKRYENVISDHCARKSHFCLSTRTTISLKDFFLTIFININMWTTIKFSYVTIIYIYKYMIFQFIFNTTKSSPLERILFLIIQSHFNSTLFHSFQQ